MVKIIWKNKNKTGELIVSDIKTYYKVIVTNIVSYWHIIKNKSMKQNTKSKHTPTHALISDQITKVVQWGKKSLFNKMCYNSLISLWGEGDWVSVSISIYVQKII